MNLSYYSGLQLTGLILNTQEVFQILFLTISDPAQVLCKGSENEESVHYLFIFKATNTPTSISLDLQVLLQ